MRQLLQNRIAICLLLAASFHGLLLLTPMERQQEPTTPTETTLQVRLNTVPAPIVNPRPEPELVAETKMSEEKQETSPATQPTVSEDSEEATNESTPAPLNPANIVAATKGILMTPKPSFKTFSREDFRSRNTELDTSRSGSLPLMLSVNTPTSSISYTGHAADLVRGPNGQSMCWQQRGIPGKPPQWYRVPLALFGHLR